MAGHTEVIHGAVIWRSWIPLHICVCISITQMSFGISHVVGCVDVDFFVVASFTFKVAGGAVSILQCNACYVM